MLSSWTIDEVHALAPSPRALQAARQLARPARWTTLGASGGLVWGTFQRVIGQTVDVEVDLAGPRFHCSCRARVTPCYHGLALLLLLAEQRHLFTATALPPRVISWLAAREAPAEAQQPAAPRPTGDNDHDYVNQRAEAISAGLLALRRWLQDLLRSGTAEAPQRPYAFWDGMARQLEAAHCPGAARQLRETARLVMVQTDGWPDLLLRDLGRLYMLTTAWPRQEQLSPPEQADLWAAAGWPPTETLPARQPPLHDTWLVVSRQPDPALYLWGTTTGRLTILNQPDTPTAAGTLLHGAVHLFPSATPLRGQWLDQPRPVDTPVPLPLGAPTIADAVARFADRCAAQPWLLRWPLLLADVHLQQETGSWRLVDHHGALLPLDDAFTSPWELLAVSAGQPLMLLGEWDGSHFWPLAAHTAGAWLDLPRPRARRRDERLV